MACNNLETYLTYSDFACVANVAKHCDTQKLCISIDEALNFDLMPLFCDSFMLDVVDNWNITEEIPNPDYVDEETTPYELITIPNPNFEKYNNIICGGRYLDSNGNVRINLGLKKAWVYFSYAQYLVLNNYNDTANGNVTKQNDWSIPTPLKDVRDFATKYRNMGLEVFKSVQTFLCDKKSEYPLFDDCDCPKNNCGCAGKCKCGKRKNLTNGIKYSVVRK